MYLFCDTETRSELDISETGAYKYASHPSTELLMVSYAFGDEDVKLWECHKGPIPDDLREGLEDPFTVIVAWNGIGFERLIFKYLLGLDISVDRFEDPMFRARAMSMPGKLEKVGKILDIKSKKITEFFVEGINMVDMFCKPLRMGGEITLFGVEPTYYRFEDRFPKEWSAFCAYCRRDVEAMREILGRMKDFPLPDEEYEYIGVDAKVNDRGAYIDSVLLQGASLVVEKEQYALTKEFVELSGIKNPKSPAQVLAYARQNGYTFPSIGKPFVKRALAGECDLTETCRKVLELRLQLSKSSVSKLESYKNSVMPDGRIRGLFNYMGAARTSRFTSGLVQVQNLVKATKAVEKNLDLALSLLKKGDYEGIKKEFSSPLDVACASLRPILCAPPGKKFVIADLSAIEARGVGWVTGCESLLNVFRENKDPYLAFAAQMDPSRTYEELYHEYKVLGKKETRNLNKPPTLGCGYSLGPGEITQDEDGNTVRTGLLGYADSMGVELTPEFATKAVEVYRRSYPEVPPFWYDLHSAFSRVVENDVVQEMGPIRMEMKGRVLCLWLPSGRALHYINPSVTWVDATSRKGNPYRKAELRVDGISQKTHQWDVIETRGAKLFENIVQAICRDILCIGMKRAEDRGLPVVLHCHDELIIEIDEDSPYGVKDLVECMIEPPSWGKDMLLGAEGYESLYYKKE